jgi:hypothetical protein
LQINPEPRSRWATANENRFHCSLPAAVGHTIRFLYTLTLDCTPEVVFIVLFRRPSVTRYEAEKLLETLANYWLAKQFYRTDDGEFVEGMLLVGDDCELLLRWWGKVRKPVPRGRPRLHPSLFGNPYQEEFELEKQKIIATRKKVRGATKEAIHVLAARHRVNFDAMRKRIRGK